MRKEYGIVATRSNARFAATLEEVRDTAVGLYQLGKNIVKASYELSAVGYATGAGTEGVDAIANGGKQVVNTVAHPIDKIYTPIHNQYVQADELDAQGQTFRAEFVRQKATIATGNVLLTVASIPSAARSFARGLSKGLTKLGAADANVVVEGASGDALLERKYAQIPDNDFQGDQRIKASADEVAAGSPEWTDTRERRALAASIYEKAGWAQKRIDQHLPGIDFDQPVLQQTISAGESVVQHQLPGAPVGNYAAPIGTPAYGLGIYTSGRTPSILTATQDVNVLRSTAAPIVDTWSWKPYEIEAPGGETQYFLPDPSKFSVSQP